MTRKARLGFCAAAVAVGLLGGALPALATTPAGVASGGSAAYVKAGVTTTIPEIAQCAVDGTTSATSGLVTGSGIKYGSATSTCTTTVVDPDEYLTTTKSETLGTLFELSALVGVGGPRIKIASYRVTCEADQGGTTASWSYGGLTGLTGLPSPMPTNYVKNVLSGTTLLATATFNEVTLPVPNDGSIGLNLLHIRFQPASGITGEVVVGATACSPTP